MSPGAGPAAAFQTLAFQILAFQTLAWLPLALFLAGCTPESAPDRFPARHQRYGILRDLVLFQRRYDAGGPFFLDRFETSRRDWDSWLAARGQGRLESSAGAGGDALVRGRHPKTGVSLTRARKFAAWRFCRLQRLDEWEHARTAGGRYHYPWGDSWRAGTWCNSRDLGLDRSTPVGTFPASMDGAGAHDLVGNVREWTETVRVPPLHYWVDPKTDKWRGPIVLFIPAEATVRQSFGLAAWLPAWQPAPTSWLVVVAATSEPRLVVGGHYGTQIPVWDELPFPTAGWWRDRDGPRYGPKTADPMPNPALLHPDAYDDLTGLRLAQDPESLLIALLGEPAPSSPGEAGLVRWFVSRPAHLQVLTEAWPRALRRVAEPGPLGPLLVAELGQ